MLNKHVYYYMFEVVTESGRQWMGKGSVHHTKAVPLYSKGGGTLARVLSHSLRFSPHCCLMHFVLYHIHWNIHYSSLPHTASQPIQSNHSHIFTQHITSTNKLIVPFSNFHSAFLFHILLYFPTIHNHTYTHSLHSFPTLSFITLQQLCHPSLTFIPHFSCTSHQHSHTLFHNTIIQRYKICISIPAILFHSSSIKQGICQGVHNLSHSLMPSLGIPKASLCAGPLNHSENLLIESVDLVCSLSWPDHTSVGIPLASFVWNYLLQWQPSEWGWLMGAVTHAYIAEVGPEELCR